MLADRTGGVAVACKQRKNMQYTELDIMSDRIIGVKVCNNSDIVEIVLCVYMPFYNREAHQTDCYAETISSDLNPQTTSVT